MCYVYSHLLTENPRSMGYKLRGQKFNIGGCNSKFYIKHFLKNKLYKLNFIWLKASLRYVPWSVVSKPWGVRNFNFGSNSINEKNAWNIILIYKFFCQQLKVQGYILFQWVYTWVGPKAKIYFNGRNVNMSGIKQHDTNIQFCTNEFPMLIGPKVLEDQNLA